MLAPEMDLALPRPPTRARPKWWLHVHSYLFAAQVLANIFLFGVCWRSFASIVPMIREEVLIGMALGQLFLLGFWLALGGLHYAARYGIVAVLILVGAALVIERVPLELVLVSAILVLLTSAALLPLRRLFGWRVNFDPAYHPEAVGRFMQVKIQDFLIWTVMCALPLAISRLLPDRGDFELIAGVGIIFLLVSVVAAPLSLAIVNCWRPWTWRLAAAGWVALVFGVEAALVELLARGTGLNFWFVVLLNGSLVATVAGNLLIMRLYGMHLFRLRPTAERDEYGVRQSAEFEAAPVSAVDS